MELKSEALPSLTGARFVAALTVVLGHYAENIGGVTGVLKPLVDSGPASVCFFYILSGFILTYNYGLKEDLRWRSFMQARIARVYPVYLLGLFLGVLDFSLRHFHWSARRQFAVMINALCLQDWVPLLQFHWFNSPAWSISCEMFFYALFPFLIQLGIRHRRNVRRILAASVIVFVLEGLLFGGVVELLIRFWISPKLQAIMSYDVAVDLIAYRAPYIRIGEFIVGIAMGMLFLSQPRQPRALKRSAAILIGLFGLFLLLYVSPLREGYESPANALMFFWAYVPIFALLVYALAQGKHFLSPALENPLMLKLGEASYALYIIHAPLLRLLKAAGLPLAACFATTLGASVLCYEYYEKPMRILLRGRKRIDLHTKIAAPQQNLSDNVP